MSPIRLTPRQLADVLLRQERGATLDTAIRETLAGAPMPPVPPMQSPRALTSDRSPPLEPSALADLALGSIAFVLLYLVVILWFAL